MFRLWSLWDMLQNYLPIYQIALDLQHLRRTAEVLSGSSYSSPKVSDSDAQHFHDFLETMKKTCSEFDLPTTSEIAGRILNREPPETYVDMFSHLDHLNDLLSHELEKEALFRIPPERKDYFEQNALYGPKVAEAFPSCARDIERAGSCYAMAQEDACVHHLMLVLERGLIALAVKV